MDIKTAQANKNSSNIFLNKYFKLILVLFAITILVLSYFVLIGPKYQSTRLIIQDNIANQKALYAQQKKKYNSLKAIAKTYSEIPAADLQKFNAVLPFAYQPESLFGEFEEIIAKGGWILNSVKIMTEEDEGNLSETAAAAAASMSGSANEKVGEIAVSLQIQAIDYGGLKNLLKMLENNQRLFDVIQVNFSGEGAEIILNTYYYSDAPQKTAEKTR